VIVNQHNTTSGGISTALAVNELTIARIELSVIPVGGSPEVTALLKQADEEEKKGNFEKADHLRNEANKKSVEDFESSTRSRHNAALAAIGTKMLIAQAAWDRFHASGDKQYLATALSAYGWIEINFIEDKSPDIRSLVAKALVNKGVTLFQQEPNKTAIDPLDIVIKYFESEREHVAKAFIMKGGFLALLDMDMTILHYYLDLVDNRFEKDTSSSVREQVADALIFKGIVSDDAVAQIAIYEKIVQRFGNDISPDVRSRVAKALVAKGEILEKQFRIQAAIDVYDMVIVRFEKDTSPNVRAEVVRAFVNKGGALSDAGTQIATYKEVIQRFGDDTSPDVRGCVAYGLVENGETLEEQGRIQAAIDVYDMVIDRFEKDTSLDVRELVGAALDNKGSALEKQGETLAASDVYEKIINYFEKNTEPHLRKTVARVREALQKLKTN
jgi:tetratricopeptide (TPR) repeat protein